MNRFFRFPSGAILVVASLLAVVYVAHAQSPTPASRLAVPILNRGAGAGDLKPPARYNLADVTIVLKRTPCFGFCPDYELRISGTGKVVYEGFNYVKVKGKQEATIPRDAVITLLRQFYSARFFDMLAEYSDELGIEVQDDDTVIERIDRVTDGATTYVTLQIGGYRKQVMDYWKTPQELRDLETKIDEAADSKRWVGP